MRNIILLICFLFNISVCIWGDNDQKVKSFLNEIKKDPELIVEYDLNSILNNIDDNNLRLISTSLFSINDFSIGRKILKEYYIPFAYSLLDLYIDKSNFISNFSLGRSNLLNEKKQIISQLKGKNINDSFNQCKLLLNSFSYINFENINNVLYYGNLHYIEKKIFGNDTKMKQVDPYPDDIIQRVRKICTIHTDDVFSDLLESLSSISLPFLPNNRINENLLEDIIILSTYTNISTMSVIVEKAFSHSSIQNINSLFDFSIKVLRKRYNNNLPSEFYDYLKLEGIDLTSNILKLNEFKIYRDSLLFEDREYAKFLPFECPDNLKNKEGFQEYYDQYYNYATKLLKSNINNTTSIKSNLLNILGFKNEEDFMEFYTDETIRRFYNGNALNSLQNLDLIYQYQVSNDIPNANVMLKLSGELIDLTPYKISNLIKTKLLPIITYNINRPECDINFKLKSFSLLASYYTTIYNLKSYKSIELYLEFIDKYIKKVDNHSRDFVCYHTAKAYNNLKDYEKSLKYLTKISADNFVSKQLYNSLKFDNLYNLKDSIKLNKLLQHMGILNSIQCSQLLQMALDANNTNDINKYIEMFNNSIINDFNKLVYFDSKEQEWQYYLLKTQIESVLWIPFMTLEIKLLVIEDKESVQKELSKIRGLVYNWALASKGAILRNVVSAQNFVKVKLNKEEYQKIQKGLIKSNTNLEHKNDSYNPYRDLYLRMLNQKYMSLLRTPENKIIENYDFRKVREKLTKNDVAIEFICFDGFFYACVLRHDWVYPEILETDIDDANLYEEVWEPIEKYLKPGDRVFFSLDNELNKYNIELITDKDGVCMADKYNLYRVSSTNKLCSDLYVKDIHSAVLYGNLTYSKTPNTNKMFGKNYRGVLMPFWEYLPETRKEILFIKENLPVNDFLVFDKYRGDKKSFVNLSSKKVNLVHMASHAFFWPYDEKENGEKVPPMMRSGIVLSGSEVDMYYDRNSKTIFANEIANLDLSSVKLLVLSACQTGDGQVKNEGVFGLQRGFKQAGVGTIIMSLRNVDSNTTVLFMQEFYRAFSEGYSARRSFRLAQKKLELISDNDDWKSFIMLD